MTAKTYWQGLNVGAADHVLAKFVAPLCGGTTVLDEIVAERRRQIGKGWTPKHDDGHAHGEIIYAEGWGAQARLQYAMVRKPNTNGQRRCLLEAAAMIVAEI